MMVSTGREPDPKFAGRAGGGVPPMGAGVPPAGVVDPSSGGLSPATLAGLSTAGAGALPGKGCTGFCERMGGSPAGRYGGRGVGGGPS
ncbi:MAG: hypothetical protein WBX00_29345, partial [Isosphaeraceae bacterium]